MSFVRRRIELVIRLGQGQFGNDGSNTVTLTGYRVIVHIEKVAGPGLGLASIRIFGLSKDLMSALSALNNADMAQRKNIIAVLAGDDEVGMALVFQGCIMDGRPFMNEAPEASLLLTAQGGGSAIVQRSQPISYQGSADVATIASSIAAAAGWNFQNFGVQMKLQTPYLWGDPVAQWRQLAEAGEGQFHCQLDDGDGKDKAQTLVLWPVSGSRGGLIPLISPATGLVGYPNYSTSVVGLDIKTRFNPSLAIGGKVQIQNDESCPLTSANGIWKVWNIVHDLESESPGGPWFTSFNAAFPEQS